MRSIALQIEPVRPHDICDTLYARFNAAPECMLLAVVDGDGHPVGLVERNDFLTLFAGQYGRSLYGQRPVGRIMETDPLVVDVEVRAADFAEMALETFPEKLRRGFIIYEHGCYYGVGTIIDLLKSTVQERARNANRLEQLVNSDSLTGLANRHHLSHHLQQATARGWPTALLALDLDRFKQVNDSFGHDIGDRLLQAVAGRLQQVLRPRDLAARLGGDEFAVVLDQIGDAEVALQVAQRLSASLAEPFVLDDKVLFIGGSAGIALYPEDGADVCELMKHADMALYAAKADCKGGARRFCPSMLSGLEWRGALEADLRRALEHGQIEVVLQPIMRLADDAITGYEALIRWNHPEHGYIPPSTFIPIAEDVGLIVPIGEWMIHSACQLLCRLPAHQTISVNVSSVQFRLPGLVATVTQALARCGLPPERLVLEITESVLMKGEEQVLRSLRQLRELGVCVALDDFGTGFASFAYLQRFSFDSIKIDRSFTAGLPGSAESRAIVSAVSVLASQLDLTVTVEGVETEAQLAAVRRLGCHEAQGYLIGMPATGAPGLAPEAVCIMPEADRAA